MLSVILTELGIAVFEEQKCIKTFPFSEPAEDYVFVKKGQSRLSDLTRFLHEKDIENILLAINKDKLKLESLLRQSISLKRDKQKQMASLRKMRIKREKELNRIRQDKSALANYMQEKSAGVKQLESIIAIRDAR